MHAVCRSDGPLRPRVLLYEKMRQHCVVSAGPSSPRGIVNLRSAGICDTIKSGRYTCGGSQPEAESVSGAAVVCPLALVLPSSLPHLRPDPPALAQATARRASRVIEDQVTFGRHCRQPIHHSPSILNRRHYRTPRAAQPWLDTVSPRIHPSGASHLVLHHRRCLRVSLC